VRDLSPYSRTHPRIIFFTLHGSRKSRGAVCENLAADEDGKTNAVFCRTVSLDCRTPSVSSTAIEQVGWKERSQRHGVLVVGAENGNCPLYLDRLVMRRSYYIYVYVLKPKMQNSWSHLEVANVGTPLVSIVVSRAVAKGLCISSDFPDIVCSGIGFEPMKDCSGKSHDWVRCGSEQRSVATVEIDWYTCIVCEA
jgi:hypothetical protein